MKTFRFDKETNEIIKVLTGKFIVAILVLMFAAAFMYIALGVITHF